MKFPLSVLALLACLSGSVLADEYVHPFHYPQPEDADEFYTVVEIPAGSITKYEIDPETGFVVVDRYVSMPVAYPANYGSIPSSLGGDGDPLDSLVLTREPVVPGALIRARPIGVLHMIDGGEQDDKIIAVPTRDIDPTYDDIHSIEDLPAIERQRIEAFFRVYKEIPEHGKVVELKGFSGAEEARAIIRKACANYQAQAD